MSADGQERAYWVSVLERVARPVLAALAAGQLKRDMPVETSGGGGASLPAGKRDLFTHLEAIGRLLAGIGPWLECGELAGDEAALREDLAGLATRALANIVDPASPDRLDFNAGRQVVVDTALLAQGLLRAPTRLWRALDPTTQGRLVDAMISTRQYALPFNNWLLFAATTEVMIRAANERWDRVRIDYALHQHEQWYKGDGVYGDGPEFHWDYYNAFVIQPMMLDILDHVADGDWWWKSIRPTVIKRAQRYAAIQERLISPEGTFPPIGRSLAYRFGALQLLGQVALRHELPDGLSPAQVRCAMTAVIRRMTAPGSAPGTFDERGWLRIGFCGHQPAIGEPYISTGSLYLCAAGLLPLGLPPSDPFWRDPPAKWTSQRVWSGEDVPADHAI